MSSVRDKHGCLPDIEGRKVDLGCGPRKRSPEYVGVDIIDHRGVDIVGDVFEVLALVPTESLAGIYSSHFFEHVDDVPLFLQELARVLRPGGLLEVVVPHFSNPHYYSDLTHVTPFGLYTFSYLAVDPLYSRQVPAYNRGDDFLLRSVRLRFKSSPPFYGRYAAKRIVEKLVNISRWTQEFYEENLCYLLPCYELSFHLERTPTAARPVAS